MCLLRPLKRNVAVRILPEPERGFYDENGNKVLLTGLGLPSGNMIAELLGAGPQAVPELQEARWVLIPRFRPNLPPGSVVMLDSREVLAVVEDYATTN